MASIRKQRDSYEIRECRRTKAGPRQFTLVRFKHILTPDVLDTAAARARRPFDRRQLIERARERGIPFTPHRRSASARRLLAELRGGAPLDPSLVALLKAALAPMEGRPVPAHLADAAEWLGKSEAARGKALRGLLRSAGRVLRSRGTLREPPPEPFPRFRSAEPEPAEA